MSFNSDFSLFPIKKLGISGWEYRKATWPPEVDKLVHELFDGKISGPINYTRTRYFDKKEQNCSVEKIGSDTFIMKPGDGYNYIIKRNSHTNDENKKNSDDNDLPYDLLCLVCQDNRRSYSVECGHVVACADCADLIFNQPKKECPVCRQPFYSKLKKLYF